MLPHPVLKPIPDTSFVLKCVNKPRNGRRS
jgi:hypothetical protein